MIAGKVEIACITFPDGKNEDALAIYPEGNQDAPICLIAPLSNVTETDEANGARIVALWNAAAGMSNEEAVSLLNGTHLLEDTK